MNGVMGRRGKMGSALMERSALAIIQLFPIQLIRLVMLYCSLQLITNVFIAFFGIGNRRGLEIGNGGV